jgi:hypothetical protein
MALSLVPRYGTSPRGVRRIRQKPVQDSCSMAPEARSTTHVQTGRRIFAELPDAPGVPPGSRP